MHPPEGRSYEAMYRYAATDMLDRHVLREQMTLLGARTVATEIQRFALRPPMRLVVPPEDSTTKDPEHMP